MATRLQLHENPPREFVQEVKGSIKGVNRMLWQRVEGSVSDGDK